MTPFRGWLPSGQDPLLLALAAITVARSAVFVFWPGSHFDADQAITGLMEREVGVLRAALEVRAEANWVFGLLTEAAYVREASRVLDALIALGVQLELALGLPDYFYPAGPGSCADGRSRYSQLRLFSLRGAVNAVPDSCSA